MEIRLRRRKKIYIIWRANANVGLFSNVYIFLSHIIFAHNNGMVPVIDMMTKNNLYLEDDELNKINAWELFFEQPDRVKLDDIHWNSKKIYSDGADCVKEPFFSWKELDWLYDDTMFDYYLKEYKRNIRINDNVKRCLVEKKEKLQFGKYKVLGILCRGTDYILNRPKGHPIQPPVQMVIDKTKKVLEEQGCEKIFLATEDKEISELFYKEFADKMIINDNELLETQKGEQISDVIQKRKVNRYEFGKNYLLNILLLSECNYFISGAVSATAFVYLQNEKKFEYSYIWQLGYYE